VGDRINGIKMKKFKKNQEILKNIQYLLDKMGGGAIIGI
jgi:hypothetical protein